MSFRALREMAGKRIRGVEGYDARQHPFGAEALRPVQNSGAWFRPTDLWAMNPTRRPLRHSAMEKSAAEHSLRRVRKMGWQTARRRVLVHVPCANAA